MEESHLEYSAPSSPLTIEPPLMGTFLSKCSWLTAASRLSSGLSTQECTLWPPLPPLPTWSSFKFGVKCHLLYYTHRASLAYTDCLSSELKHLSASHVAAFVNIDHFLPGTSFIQPDWRLLEDQNQYLFFLEPYCTFARALGRISNIIYYSLVYIAK